MEFQITDAKGNEYGAEVNSFNQLQVASVSQSRENYSTEFGNAFQVTNGRINLTNDSKSALLYIKNDSENDLVMDRVVLIQGSSTNGVGDASFQTLRNPTAGTIITNASLAGVSNSNHGSSNAINGLNYKGVQGDTFTNGTGVNLPIMQSQNRSTFPLNRVLPKGSSIGWAYTPPLSNTSIDIVIVAHVYYLIR
jgi:hypothetical protein